MLFVKVSIDPRFLTGQHTLMLFAVLSFVELFMPPLQKQTLRRSLIRR